MKKTIVMTVNNRPGYLAAVLASLTNCSGISSYHVMPFIEPSDQREAIEKMLVRFGRATGCKVSLHFNEHQRGVLGNPHHALSTAFDRGSDYTILVEEDTVLAVDALRYFEWCDDHYFQDKGVLAICAFQDSVPDDSPAHGVSRFHRFSALAWSTWRDRWVNVLRDDWDFDDSLGGWDNHITNHIIPSKNLAVIRPRRSRSQHIGKFGGTHCTPAMFEGLQAPLYQDDYGPGTFHAVEPPFHPRTRVVVAHSARAPRERVSRWIWGRGLPAYCDWRIPDEFPEGPNIVPVPPFTFAQYPAFEHTDLIEDPERFDAVDDGALVWVRGSWLPSFVTQVLSRLRARIVLVTGDSDAPMPSAAGAAARALLDSPNIVHWYTQNYDGTAPLERVSPLPIGLDFHTLSERPLWGEPITPSSAQEAELDAIVASLPPLDGRIPKIYVDFSWQKETGTYQDEVRTPVVELLADHPLVVHQHEPLPRSEMWRRKGQYAFSLSPRGAGLDCHRTWEALVLGQVVLFPSSSLNPMFQGLRAFPLDYWEELTMPNLIRWLALARQLPDPEAALTNEYWIEKMRAGADRLATPP